MLGISWGRTPAGQDALLIGGHELPVSFLAALAAVIGVLVVLKARSSSSNLVKAGTAPAAAAAAAPATSSADPNATTLAGFDASAQITNLSDSVAQLQNEVAQLSSSPAGSVPATSSTTPATLTQAQIEADISSALQQALAGLQERPQTPPATPPSTPLPPAPQTGSSFPSAPPATGPYSPFASFNPATASEGDWVSLTQYVQTLRGNPSAIPPQFQSWMTSPAAPSWVQQDAASVWGTPSPSTTSAPSTSHLSAVPTHPLPVSGSDALHNPPIPLPVHTPAPSGAPPSGTEFTASNALQPPRSAIKVPTRKAA